MDAACLTGLQRSYPEIAGNLRVSLTRLFGSLEPARVALFGVRPPQDPWAAVHATLPLQRDAVVLQAPCGVVQPGVPPRWFMAYGQHSGSRWARTASNFVQSLCDLAVCDDLLSADEARRGRGFQFVHVARVRLDIAWEMPLGTAGLLPLRADAVHVPRMNAKAGVCDKFAFGLRQPMRVYLRRAYAIPLASALLNRSRGAATAARGRALSRFAVEARRSRLDNRSAQELIVQRPLRRGAHAAWQLPARHGGSRVLPLLRASRASARSAAAADGDNSTALAAVAAAAADAAAALGPLHTFRMTSEGFVEWVLWRANVSVVYTAAWSLCKFSDAANATARTCVPRMRRRQPCSALICEGQATDCTCRVDGGACGGAWYCREVPPGAQLGVDGVGFGGSSGGAALEAQHGCQVVNKSRHPVASCKFVKPGQPLR